MAVWAILLVLLGYLIAGIVGALLVLLLIVLFGLSL